MPSDDLILSEVHVEVPHGTVGDTLATTRFSFCTPTGPQPANPSDSSDDSEVDDDGDAAVRRPRRSFFTIHHQLATPLQQVGRQVWNGACFFVDLLLHNPDLVRDKVVLDVGAGVGLASVAAALTAKTVFCTDAEPTALELAARNAAANSRHFQHGPTTMAVRHLDFLDPGSLLALLGDAAAAGATRVPPACFPCSGHSSCSSNVLTAHDAAEGQADAGRSRPAPVCEQSTPVAPAGGSDGPAAVQSPERSSWPAPLRQGHSSLAPPSELAEEHRWGTADEEAVRQVEVVLAGDVVYDDAITEAFVECALALLARLASGGKVAVLLVAVEKRYNFTLEDLGVRAPAYDHFLSCLQQQSSRYTAAGWHCKSRRVDTSCVPQAVAEYDRSGDMEMWRVEMVPPARAV